MIQKSAKGKKVFVGLSGGVDSAVSALILINAGYDVTGVFIKVWQPDWINCTWKEERRDAMRVAAHLNISFVTLDLVKEYKQDVIDYMIKEYENGRTPNPDVMCNRYVKFGGFWKWAMSQGADYIATGHYARIKSEILNGDSIEIFQLLKGTDDNKDQSYFLWTLNQNDLPHVLFPVGNYTKPEVRELAKKYKLPNSLKKDSQGLCFIGKVDVKKFLSHYIKTTAGNVLDKNGNTIGIHPGALYFTIGERHGFTITKKTPSDKPFYVVDKNMEQNTITVSNTGNDIQTQILDKSANKIAKINNVNWVNGSILKLFKNQDYSLEARTRYRQPLQKIRIITVDSITATIEFEQPQDTLSPGQSLVIYYKEKCLGGGIIK